MSVVHITITTSGHFMEISQPMDRIGLRSEYLIHGKYWRYVGETVAPQGPDAHEQLRAWSPDPGGRYLEHCPASLLDRILYEGKVAVYAESVLQVFEVRI